LLVEVSENLRDHHRNLNAGDDPDCPPQAWQISMSILNTRFKRCAHVMEACRSDAVG
jgi:hypothetical protein